MRGVLNTNVLVSGLLKPAGNERHVLRLGFARRFTVLLSAPIFAESEVVLPRPRFKLRPTDGYQASRALRSRGFQKGELILIAVTASALDDDRRRCLAAGMDDYLSKPVRPEELEAMLKRWDPAAATFGNVVAATEP